MKDPKGLHIYMTVNFKRVTREDCGITTEAFTVSLGLSSETLRGFVEVSISGRAL